MELLNFWAARLVAVAEPMLWQSSLLIGLLFVLDWALRRKLRAGVRYALWLLVLLKLVLPPSLALPSGLGWWLRQATLVPAAHRSRALVVTYDAKTVPSLPTANLAPASILPRTSLSLAARGLLISGGISLGLLMWMLVRWRQVRRDARPVVSAPEWLTSLLEETRDCAEVRRLVGLKVIDREISPAVCGLFRPVLLVPRNLVEQLSPQQMRTILLHELMHLRRGDVGVNCVQALLQVVYWWHPLLWLANARIRRVREEAVDDAVMVALRHEAETYAPTLLQVAKLALRRPLTSLGLVGILESHGALRQRIERLINFHPPRRAGLTLGSALCVVAFGTVALPMGQAPAPEAAAEAAPATSAPQGAPVADAGQPARLAGLVQEAKLLYEQGKLDEAETRLKAVLAQDPQQAAASYYLARLGEARALKARKPNVVVSGPTPQPATNNAYRTTYTSQGRKAILAKLNTIRFDRVQFDNMRLDEVVRFLTEEARKRDPAQQGVNFILNPNSPPGSNAAAADLGSLPIQISPALSNLRLADVLDALVKVAGAPIKYSLEDYAVIFSWRGNEAPPLYLRNYKVDPNTFRQGLDGVNGTRLPPGADASQLNRNLQKRFQDIGVDLKPPKSLFYNERQGTLLVRATLEDLDVIGAAIQGINLPPAQVMIQTRFFAIPEELTQAGTNRHSGWFWDFSHLQEGSTVLHPAQAGQVQKALESAFGVELLSRGAVTTLSGRQAQIQAVSLQSIATNINPLALHPPGITNAPDGMGLFLAEQVPFGPTLDVTASVSADGSTIQLTALASLTEFLGYDEPTNSVTAYVDGKQQAVSVPRPRFGVWQVNASALVRDGRTLLLGGPLDGFGSRTKPSGTKRKWLLAMLTPTAIDPAGNRIHPEDEQPGTPAR